MTAETKSKEVKAKSKSSSSAAKKKTGGAKKVNTPVEMILSGDLTLPRAAEIKADFVAAVKAKKDLELLFKDVSDVDLSFVQLLCSTQRAAESVGMKISYPGPWPEVFVSLVKDSGFSQHVGCHSDCSAACPWIMQ